MGVKGSINLQLIQCKNIYFCKPSSCYFGVMKIEIPWETRLPQPTPPPLPHSSCIPTSLALWAHVQAFARNAWYPTLNLCWLWLFRFLFDYSLQLNVNNNNKQINSHKFPIISHSISGIIGPSIKTPLFSIFFFVLTHRALNNDTPNRNKCLSNNSPRSCKCILEVIGYDRVFHDIANTPDSKRVGRNQIIQESDTKKNGNIKYNLDFKARKWRLCHVNYLVRYPIRASILKN